MLNAKRPASRSHHPKLFPCLPFLLITIRSISSVACLVHFRQTPSLFGTQRLLAFTRRRTTVRPKTLRSHRAAARVCARLLHHRESDRNTPHHLLRRGSEISAGIHGDCPQQRRLPHRSLSTAARTPALPSAPAPLMTSAIPPSAQPPHQAATATVPHSASGTTSPLPGAVPAQPPARSYASATKTASQVAAAPAGASAQNAKSTESPVNGANATAHGGSQPNGTSNNNVDHGRKPSVVISASGASGSIPNGGPVGQNGRPPIHFGAMNSSPLPTHSVPYSSQTANLPTPASNPRVISPAHSPSPIPQPQAASGGRPPSSLQNQSNGMTFGSLGGEDSSVSESAPWTTQIYMTRAD